MQQDADLGGGHDERQRRRLEQAGRHGVPPAGALGVEQGGDPPHEEQREKEERNTGEGARTGEQGIEVEA